jgi:hypothetical protein
VGVARLALIRAVDLFDWRLGWRITTFAEPRVVGAIKRAREKNARDVVARRLFATERREYAVDSTDPSAPRLLLPLRDSRVGRRTGDAADRPGGPSPLAIRF